MKRSKEERALISEWIASEQGQRAIESDIENQWNEFKDDSARSFNHQKLFHRLKRRIDAQKRGAHIHRYLRYAMETAAAILIVSSISLLLKEKEVVYKDVPQFVEVYNPKGVRTTVTLPDSSKVILNADSRISYTDKFEGKTRAVTLTGEAFFEVTKEASRPFVVYAHNATLTVLGTTFNIRSYPEDTHTEATLIEGALQVNNELLTPGNQIVIDNHSKTSLLQEVDTERVIGWIKGDLYFQSMTFPEIATVLGRKFSINIDITTKSVQEKVLNGKFTNEESLDQILNVIQRTIDFTRYYDPENNTLTIK